MPICFSSYIIILYIYTLTYQNGDIKSNPLKKVLHMLMEHLTPDIQVFDYQWEIVNIIP